MNYSDCLKSDSGLTLWRLLYRKAILEVRHGNLGDRLDQAETEIFLRLQELSQDGPSGHHHNELKELTEAMAGLRIRRTGILNPD